MHVFALITSLALIEYFAMVIGTALARKRYKIEAPATTGHPIFERHFRVQQNTLEQLIIFLPALSIFSNYWEGAAALGGVGGLFIVGRALYWAGYVKDAKKRAPGMFLTTIAQMILLGGSLYGAILAIREVGLAE